jgi:hypothetical protein
MSLPKAVQDQLDEADRLVAELAGDKTEGDNPTETDPENIPPDPSPDPQPEPSISNEPKHEPDPVPDSKWEAKYHTLKGMYDAEVPRLHSQVRELNTQVQTLIAEVERAKVQTAAQESVESLITEQDKEAFGPDLIDLIERATASKVSTLQARESELVNEIRELKAQLGNVSERQVMSDKDRFINGLSRQVPDWEVLNTDQGFLNWLQEVDPVYGLPRHAALTAAYEGGDVDRVSAIFNTYKALVGAPKQNAKGKANQELQRQVAPTRSRSSAPPADSQNQQIYSQEQIAEFYDEWRRGLIDNDEAVRTEKLIHAAITEGRIR